MRALDDIVMRFPRDLDEALRLQADPATRGVPLAGGTDLMVVWKAGAVRAPETALDLSGLDALRGIRKAGPFVVIGALTTHAELRASPIVRERLPALAQAAATVGGPPIQNRGTIGGNLVNASPAGDLAPPLLAAGARAVLVSARGERTLPLTDFFIDYRRTALRADELLARMLVPPLPDGAWEGFRKIGTRAAQAISKVMAAVRIRRDGDRLVDPALALGSVAAVPVRLPEVEAWLNGRAPDEAVLKELEARIGAAIHPMDDIRSTAAYRKGVAGRLVRGMLE